MKTPDVVLFCFAGRKANLELQLPWVRSVLQRHPHVKFHLWNLTRTAADDQYVRSIRGERIQVIHDLAGPNPWTRFDDVYRVYTDPQWAKHLFVKVDDDVVFLETKRFGRFVDAIQANSDQVLSAQVVNNGACTRTHDGLWRAYLPLDIELLDVHLSTQYATISHRYLLDQPENLLEQDWKLHPTADWLSINVIGYDWQMGGRIAALLGRETPTYIAGRRFRGGPIGDEGRVNQLPRMVCQGFTAGHLTFGPQEKAFVEADLNELRGRYAELNNSYLSEDQ